MAGKIQNRLAHLEQGRAEQRIEVPLYSCTIDGEEQELSALDFAFLLTQGPIGEMGARCGVRYEELVDDGLTFEQRAAEVSAYFEEAVREYNSPEAVAKRKAEYEELRRIGELRRQDFYCGRDMDKCHPLPWQRKESTE